MITTKMSLMGLLMALSALSISAPATATAETPQTIEGRLSRLTIVIRERADQLPASEQINLEQLVAIGWADGNGRDWVNGRRGSGWADGRGGSWSNVNSWRNGWTDGGSFYNRY